MKENDKQELNTAPIHPYYYPPAVFPQDDEINLLDILAVLGKKKKLIIAIILLTTFTGSLFALFKPDVYDYSTAIQIGSYFVDNQEKALDDAKNAESKIKEIYIPLVLSEFYKQNPGHQKNIKINVSVPKESQIVILNSKSTVAESQIFQDLINKISAKLIDDHNELAKAHVIALMEQVANAKNRLTLLGENEKEITKRIEEFDKNFKTAPIDNSGTTVLVMAELTNQKQLIENQKYDQESLVSQKQAELNLIKESKRFMPVTQSIEPVGIGRAMIVIMSLLLGLIAAVIVAFTVDFIEKAKSQIVVSK